MYKEMKKVLAKAVCVRKRGRQGGMRGETEREIDRMLPLEEQRVSGSEGHWPVFCQVCKVLGPRGMWWVGRNPSLPVRSAPLLD